MFPTFKKYALKTRRDKENHPSIWDEVDNQYAALSPLFLEHRDPIEMRAVILPEIRRIVEGEKKGPHVWKGELVQLEIYPETSKIISEYLLEEVKENKIDIPSKDVLSLIEEWIIFVEQVYERDLNLTQDMYTAIQDLSASLPLVVEDRKFRFIRFKVSDYTFLAGFFPHGKVFHLNYTDEQEAPYNNIIQKEFPIDPDFKILKEISQHVGNILKSV